MKNMAEEYGTTPEKKSFLEHKYEKIQLPFKYESKEAWETMTMYAQTYVILLAVVIGFLVSSIFSAEFRPGTEDVFFASKYGRSKAIKNKIIAGALMATTVYWSGAGLLSLISFAVMGTSGFITPYQISDPYSIYFNIRRILPFDIGEWLCCNNVMCGVSHVGNNKNAYTEFSGLSTIYITLRDAVY